MNEAENEYEIDYGVKFLTIQFTIALNQNIC